MINSAAEFAQVRKNEDPHEHGSSFNDTGCRIRAIWGHLPHRAADDDFKYRPACKVVVFLDLLQHVTEALRRR
jgi:hypothetical protein